MTLYFPTLNSEPGIDLRMPGNTIQPNVDISIAETEYLNIAPKNALPLHTSGSYHVIEFDIPPLNSYIDFKSIFLDLTLSIVKNDGTAVDPSQRIMIIPNAAHSVIRSISISFNDQEVCDPNPFFPLISYLQTLLGLPKDADETLGEVMGFYNTNNKTLPASFSANSPAQSIYTKLQRSKSINLYAPLITDFVSAESYFPDKIKIKIEITFRNEASFPVWSTTTDIENYILKIHKCKLIIKTIKPTLEYLQKVEKKNLVNESSYLHFNYKRIKTISNTIPAQSSYLFVQNPFGGYVPELLIIILQEQSIWNGKYHNNPLYFDHYKLNQLIIKSGNNIAYNLITDFENKETGAAYMTTLQSLGLENTIRSNLTFKDFNEGGKTIFAFDLTKDGFSMEKTHFRINNPIDIELNFKESVTRALDVIFIAFFSAEILIDKNRRIILNAVV